jgi:hypothetical protein
MSSIGLARAHELLSAFVVPIKDAAQGSFREKRFHLIFLGEQGFA